MANLLELKNRIYQDKKIEQILQELDCRFIKQEQNGSLITAGLPSEFNSNNKRTIQIKNTPTLTSYIRSKDISGDIFAVISYILYNTENFEQVKEKLFDVTVWIANTLGYDDLFYNNYSITPSDNIPKQNPWTKFLKEIKQNRKNITYSNIDPNQQNKILPEIILEQYIELPHKHFLKEGITRQTQYEFEIGYDIQTERITIPIRNINGELISVKGRYVGRDQETEENYKYIYLHEFNKSIEFFNLYRALPYIQKQKEVIILEGEKSCMLLHQWNFKNNIAIGSKGLSPFQANLLKKLECPIIFAFDKDVDKNLIKKQIKQIHNRPIFVIYDNNNLLQNKDSPIDRGYNIWYNLYTNHKYRFNNI